MKVIAITPLQRQKLKRLLDAEAATAEQVHTAEQIYRAAAQARQDVFELIVETHQFDPKRVDATKRIELRENGNLVFYELPAETDSGSES